MKSPRQVASSQLVERQYANNGCYKDTRSPRDRLRIRAQIHNSLGCSKISRDSRGRRADLHAVQQDKVLDTWPEGTSIRSRRLLAYIFDRILERWNFTVLTRIWRRSAISRFDNRLRTSSRI